LKVLKQKFHSKKLNQDIDNQNNLCYNTSISYFLNKNIKNQKAKMENFKINDYSTNEQDKKSLERENSFEEFQDFKFDSFESLNSEQQKEIEKTQESSKNEALENLNDIYARERNADRENSSFFLRDDEIKNLNIVHFEDYDANFETYEGRENEFSLRENQFKTQEQLVQEISTMKSVRREVPAGQRFSNIIRAISGRIAA
jgi:hypothetical protein